MFSKDDQIDLKEVSVSLLRHKALIAKITVPFVAFSFIYAFTREPVWEGQFQIVLEDENFNSNSLSPLSLANLAAIRGGRNSNELDTEERC